MTCLDFEVGVVYRVGDLIQAFLDGDIDAMAHQTNCYGIFGAGIAGQISTHLPPLTNSDIEDGRSPVDKLGSVSSYKDDRGAYAFNLYGQLAPGRSDDYEALGCSLMEMASILREAEFVGSIGLPLLGCGIGGRSWGETAEIIEKALDGFDVIIYTVDKKAMIRSMTEHKQRKSK